MIVCEGEPVQLDGFSENVCGLQWVTFDGTGSFSDETIEDPIYLPSAQDVISGTVHLILIGAPCGVCTEPAIDTMALTIQRLPAIDLGEEEATICEDGSYTSIATATDYSSVLWTTTGDGEFDDATLLNATYTPGPGDIANKAVVLTLTVQAVGPCFPAATDSADILINIQLLPFIDIIPDSDTICYDQSYDFTGKVDVSNYDAIQWFTTNGVGQFSDENVPYPTYYPSPLDYLTGCIEIGVVVSPLAPCLGNGSTDIMILCFQPPVNIEIEGDATICEDATYTPEPYLLENACGVLWTTEGDGEFDDAALEYPAYTPGIADIAAEFVILHVTGIGCSTCGDFTADVYLSIQLNPIADAGPDGVVCEHLCLPPWSNGQYQLNGTVTNASGQLWTSATGGTFNDASLLNAVYTVSNDDLANGFVELCLTAAPIDPCTVSDTDCMTLTIQYAPIANAGPDQEICEGESAQLDGTTTNASGVFWDFAFYGEGDGTWSNQLIEDPIYTPGPEDIELGYVELIMVAFPINPCTYPAVDIMKLSIIQEPVANAGPDATICAGETFELAEAFVENATALLWTGGTGTFEPSANVQNPTYIPGIGEMGIVTLCLEAIDGTACTAGYTDCMELTILAPPTADAGPDAVICEYEEFTTDPVVSNYSSVLWTHNGNGSFDDPTLLAATYTPGIDDVSVELCIEVFSIDPCSITVSDCMILTLNPEPAVGFCFNGELAGTGSEFEYCYNETVTVSLCEVWAGVGPFEVCYILNNEDEVCVTVDEGGNLFSGVLPVGTHTVNVTSITDVNGCMAQDVDPYIAYVTINPEPVAAFCFNEEVAGTGSVFEYCYNEIVTVDLCEIVAGTGPFEVCYTVNAAVPEVCVTVAEGDALFSEVLPAGTYDIQITSITDANGCVASDVTPYNATVIVNEEPLVIFCFNGEQAAQGSEFTYCEDTEVEVALCDVWSGTGPFEVCYTVNAEPEVCITVEEGDALFTDMLPVGTYQIVVTSIVDANGCSPSDIGIYTATVIINANPTVFAGDDATICEEMTYTFADATAANYSSVLWTGGLGTFDDANMVNATYTPYLGEYGTIEFILTAFPIDPCTMPAYDTVNLTIQQGPSTIEAFF